MKWATTRWYNLVMIAINIMSFALGYYIYTLGVNDISTTIIVGTVLAATLSLVYYTMNLIEKTMEERKTSI